MFFDMLRAHIPKSLRAGVALAVMVVALFSAFSALPALAANTPGKSWLQLVAGLLIGIPALVCFYYFQGKDGQPKSLDGITIETLAEAGKKRVEISPANIPDEPPRGPKPIP